MSEVRLCFHAKNAFEVEGPINCVNAFSRCNPKYDVFYAVNPTKPKIPKEPEYNDTPGENFYIKDEEDHEDDYNNYDDNDDDDEYIEDLSEDDIYIFDNKYLYSLIKD